MTTLRRIWSYLKSLPKRFWSWLKNLGNDDDDFGGWVW